MTIVKNAAYCKHCRQLLTSIDDTIVVCTGAHLAVSGGTKRLKRIFLKDKVRWEDRSVIDGDKKLEKERAEVQW